MHSFTLALSSWPLCIYFLFHFGPCCVRYFFVIQSLRYIYFYHGGDFLKLCGFSTRDGIINSLFFLFRVYFCFILCKISLVSLGIWWILYLLFIVFMSWLCRFWCISIQWLKSNYLRQSTNNLKMSQCKASKAIVNSMIFNNNIVFLIVGNLIKPLLEKCELSITNLCDTNMFFTVFSLNNCIERKHNQCMLKHQRKQEEGNKYISQHGTVSSSFFSFSEWEYLDAIQNHTLASWSWKWNSLFINYHFDIHYWPSESGWKRYLIHISHFQQPHSLLLKSVCKDGLKSIWSLCLAWCEVYCPWHNSSPFKPLVSNNNFKDMLALYYSIVRHLMVHFKF